MSINYIQMIQDIFNYFDNLIGISSDLKKNLEEYLEFTNKKASN